jgi:hypothetical protein
VIDTRWQVAAYIFVSVVLWMVAAQLFQRRIRISWISTLKEGWAASIMRFVYFVGLPYAALILGVMPARYMGLVGLERWPAEQSSLLGSGFASAVRQALSMVQGSLSGVILDWLPDVEKVAGLVVIMFLVLGATWLGYGYFRRGVISDLGIDLPSLPGEMRTSVVQIAYQGIHWSFYRGAVWLLIGDLYLAVVGGILLVSGEWILDAGWSNKTQHALWREARLVDASILIATSVVFLFVPNLWLLLPVHWVLAVVSRRVLALQWRAASSS